MTLDYFYGEQADQFTFYRIPKALFVDERFKPISAEAKILYGILLDRMGLSRKNGWLDEDDGWIINSIGYIPGNNGASDSYTIAVYTDDNSSMQNGENTIEKLAKSTSKILNK